MIIDTSELSGRQLRERLYGALDLPDDGQTLALQLISFGYKHGVPLEADLVFDVRFMENPFYIDRLRPLTGLDEEVRDFVLVQPITRAVPQTRRRSSSSSSLPGFHDEGRSRLTIAFGCTGGQHRSIAIAEEVARRLRESGTAPVSVWHRELERREPGNGEPTASEPSSAAIRRRASRRASVALLRRWLRPGIGIKRWLLVVFVGELLIALRRRARSSGRSSPSDGRSARSNCRRLLTLQFLPELRALRRPRRRCRALRLRRLARRARAGRAVPAAR